MTTLLERPVLMVVLATITVLVLGMFWLQTQRREALYAVLAVILLAAAAVTTAILVETDREAVEQTLHQVALAVQQDDLEQVLAFVHPDATTIRQQASMELPKYEFDEVKVKSNLKITFDRPQDPTEATAKFNVVVAGSERHGLIRNWRVPRYCIVTFRKENQSWRVMSYSHDDAREGLLQSQP